MIAVIAAMIGASACDDDDGDDNDNVPKEWTQSDKNFATQANEANRAEIELGTLAAAQAGDSSVKVFGQMMVDDHSGALNELKALADNKNFPLSTDLTAEHQQLKTRLMGLSGFSFDTAYVNSQVVAHTQAEALFESQSNSGDDAALKSYAGKYLPHIRLHLQKSDSLHIVLTDSIPDVNDTIPDTN